MYRVGIVGMGRIAAGFDVPQGPDITTHLKGILADSRLKLVAAADAEPSRAEGELARFGVDARAVEPAELMAMDLDAICIATPDATHLSYAQMALDTAARIVFVEKPLDGDRAARNYLAGKAADAGKSLAIHHLRRWIPGLADWVAEASTGQYGRAVAATAFYTRGFRHNGIHALDLLAAFVGTAVQHARAIGEPIEDFSVTDPTTTIQAVIGATPVLLTGVDGRRQTTFEVDIRFERARVRVYDEGGVRAELYRTMGCMPAGFAPELQLAAQYIDVPAQLPAFAWANIADHLDGYACLACAGHNALLGYDLADRIAELVGS